jgi:predicted RNase H-like nuclease (RuvC/YqgF family)
MTVETLLIFILGSILGIAAAVWGLRRPLAISQRAEREREMAGLRERVSHLEHQVATLERQVLQVEGENRYLKQELERARGTIDLLTRARAGTSSDSFLTADGLDIMKLRKALTTRFDEDELRLLATDLGIKWDDIEGKTLSVRALDLLAYCERRDAVGALAAAVRKTRPGAL